MNICVWHVSQHVATCLSKAIDGLRLRAFCLVHSVAKEGSLRLPEAGRDTGLLEHKYSQLQQWPNSSSSTNPFVFPEASQGAEV